MDAKETCANASQTQEAAGRKKKRCSTVEDIQEKVFEELGDALCIFTSLGWLDNSFQLNNATVLADIQSLPTNVSEALLNGNLDECIQETLVQLGDNSKFDSCEDNYTDDELFALTRIGELYAAVTCFTSRFMAACAAQVREDIFNSILTMAAGK